MTATTADDGTCRPTDGSSNHPPRMQQPKRRKFYLMEIRRGGGSGWTLLNGKILMGTMGSPDPFQRSFPDYGARPRFRVKARSQRKFFDIRWMGDFWLVTDRAKAALTELSKTDFKFLAVDTEVDPGQPPLVLWLCDIATVLDAIDESRSQVESGLSDEGYKVHWVSGISRLTFDEAVVGEHHAFRLLTNYTVIVTDDIFRDTIRKAGLTGLSYRDASKQLGER